MAEKGAGCGGDGPDHGGRLGAEAGSPGVARGGAGTGGDEEGAVQEEVPLRPPVPVLPHAGGCVDSLGHLRAFHRRSNRRSWRGDEEEGVIGLPPWRRGSSGRRICCPGC